MTDTRNPSARSGEQQRRQQQPGSQQASGERPRGNAPPDSKSPRETDQLNPGQSTRDQSIRQAGSGWDDEESLRSNRRNEADETMRTRGQGETGEDEDLPSAGERRTPGEERDRQR